MNRREWLAGVGATAAIGSLGGCASFARGRGDRIRAENAKPGTTDWLLTNTRTDLKAQYRCSGIEGYCSRTSVRAGERLAIMVSANPASAFMLDIYRLGYYGGK